ncbi:hypothetical protein EYF80_005637 [Liparis tanakae]|uniref:Uncharacterized protein n=1 Tax=Liparis tanakae TaxID=230148 RepID=A0A4Z2J253_9TELE|nr:hypothetical protein EYF80_005637 [Liparis tanakae]
MRLLLTCFLLKGWGGKRREKKKINLNCEGPSAAIGSDTVILFSNLETTVPLSNRHKEQQQSRSVQRR